MERLQGITVDIEGASTLADCDVIEIVDDNNPYLVLLGIYWATDLNIVINLKKCKMIFEKKVSLDFLTNKMALKFFRKIYFGGTFLNLKI